MSIDKTKMPKLGFGLMRLPQKDGQIDIPQLMHMVDTYMESGMNYFDTAYVYHGGRSETAIREALVMRYPRDSFYLATKLPAWSMKTLEDRDRIFREQLERTGVDYFDFYLLHSLEEGDNYNTYVDLDCFEWGKQKVKEGKIRHFGFSFHGSPELLDKVLAQHPEVEFVQIQLNYADWNNQVVQSGRLYEVLCKYQMPAIVMEPVKGGFLAKLPAGIEALMKEARPDKSIASWALRFAGSLPGVMTILSGMSAIEQMEDNIKTFRDFEPLSSEEKTIIEAAVKKIQDLPLISCTSCRYCMDGCPRKIAIPDIFRAVNTKRTYPKDARPGKFYSSLVEIRSGKASDCLACGQCERVCPQHLPIINLLKEAVEKFEVEN